MRIVQNYNKKTYVGVVFWVRWSFDLSIVLSIGIKRVVQHNVILEQGFEMLGTLLTKQERLNIMVQFLKCNVGGREDG